MYLLTHILPILEPTFFTLLRFSLHGKRSCAKLCKKSRTYVNIGSFISSRSKPVWIEVCMVTVCNAPEFDFAQDPQFLTNSNPTTALCLCNVWETVKQAKYVGCTIKYFYFLLLLWTYVSEIKLWLIDWLIDKIRKPCCRKETALCRSCSFRFKVRQQHSLQV